MKQMKAFLVAGVLLVGTLASAASLPSEIELDPTTLQFEKLLKSPSFEVENDVPAMVTFMLNDESEVVVLSVETEMKVVELYVKSRLNYKKLDADLDTGRVYKLPVLLRSEG
ncbi:hypothetical protein [Altibacter lentus]|uniref:hypothetical protein n=1 Tax=Altibacter lentus TaxID=1223410 RepID=UPI000556B6FA|nr:hypothetical protein [Altibacter lentus]